MLSKITGGATDLLFIAKVLNKYKVSYYKCRDTGFIQTEEPYWLDEAYSSVITKLDVGLVQRNQTLSESVGKLIITHFDVNDIFLDYAGGYGLFTRMMRDKGLNFYHSDKYCTNIFAENFDITDLPQSQRFEAITAFEVFEHLANPVTEIKTILELSDNLIFTTELQPDIPLVNTEDWRYFSPETGQHISFYNERSLQTLAERLGYNFYTDGNFLHLFTKRCFDTNPLRSKKEPFLIRKIRKRLNAYDKKQFPYPESLLQKDWQYVKTLLNRQS